MLNCISLTDSFLSMTGSIMHSTWINDLFSIHRVCIKCCYFLWCHISIVWNWAHISQILLQTISNNRILHVLLLAWIIRSQLAVITLISYICLMLILLIVFRLALWTKTLSICCIVHDLLTTLVINCSSFCLEKVGGITSLVLVFIH